MLCLINTLKKDLLRYIISTIMFIESWNYYITTRISFDFGKDGKQSSYLQEMRIIQWCKASNVMSSGGLLFKTILFILSCLKNRYQYKELYLRGGIWAEHWRINGLSRRGRCLGIMSKLRERYQCLYNFGAGEKEHKIISTKIKNKSEYLRMRKHNKLHI